MHLTWQCYERFNIPPSAKSVSRLAKLQVSLVSFLYEAIVAYDVAAAAAELVSTAMTTEQ
jgi:hypothetical protein